jgi:hypothetical protein
MSSPAEQTVVNRKAVYSVVCGVVAFAAIYVTPFLGLLLALPAVTSAVHARREIAASRGTQTGDTVAFTGLLVGGGAIVTVVLQGALPLLR